MPRIRFDHVVNFSSEDTKNVADNLMNPVADPKKVWTGQKPGEMSVCVILQLERISKITEVDICNEGSAFVEVLVNRSCSDDKKFQSLLVMSSFMTPNDARGNKDRNRVRLFTYKDFTERIRDEKWDRIKFNCTQPFNSDKKYGLAHVSVYGPEDETKKQMIDLNEPVKKPVVRVPQKVALGKFGMRSESPDCSSPGSSFTPRKETISEQMKRYLAERQEAAASGREENDVTERQKKLVAEFQRHADASPKPSTSGTSKKPERNRSLDIFYDSDDDKPNPRVDRIIAKHQKEVEARKKEEAKKKLPAKKDDGNVKAKQAIPSGKRKSDSMPKRPAKKGKTETRPFNELFAGVVFTISGIVNPDRAKIRDMALKMGGKYRTNWDDTCTHLICAFTNTPKFKEVQGRGKIVKRAWIEDSFEERKRFPWRRYCLDKSDEKSESEDEILEKRPEPIKIDSSDTEDEVERILQNRKVTDPFEVETDEEKLEKKHSEINLDAVKLFDRETFYVDDIFPDIERARIEKIITLINGEIVEEISSQTNYVITNKDVVNKFNRQGQTKYVSPKWIYLMFVHKKLLNIDEYLL